MLTFWIMGALMVLLAFWFVLPPLLQRDEESKPDQSRAASLLVYQDQYQELEADLKNGLIGESQYQQETEALERRLLDEVGLQKKTPQTSGRHISRKLAYSLAVAVPVAAISFYLAVGSPKALSIEPANQTTATPR